MRIFVKTEEKRRIFFWLPLFLVLNHLTALFFPAFIRREAKKNGDSDVKLTVRQSLRFVTLCYRMRLRHPATPFVEVKIREKDGERIFVRI